MLVSILKHIDRNRFSPHLALLRNEGELFHEVPPDVEIHPAGMVGYRIGRELVGVIRRLRRIMRETRPDLVFSFMWEPNILNVLASLGTGRKVILSERVAISENLKDLFGRGMKSGLARRAIAMLYRRATRIIAVSEGIKRELILFDLPKDRISVIHNPVDIQLIERMSLGKTDAARPYIIFVGRLERQKNLPLLIRAFHAIKDRFDVDLMIVGKGKEEARLRDLCRSLKISTRVHFMGFERNPYRLMKNAEVFVLPSDFEGFPNVLLEAMACGVPVISTDCLHGPGELISDGEDGVLVPVEDMASMVGALERVICDPSLRKRLTVAGSRKVRSYDVHAVVEKYEELISCVLPAGGDDGMGHK